MKIKIELEFDTEKEEDKELVEKITSAIDSLKDHINKPKLYKTDRSSGDRATAF